MLDASAHFFSGCHFPHRFFPPGESLFFFGWIDTWKFPPTPRRGIINYRVVARNAPDLHLSLSLFFSLILSFFPSPPLPPLLGLEFRDMYVRQLQSSHFARSIARHERTKRGRLHGVAWRTASHRVASRRIASHRVDRTGFTGLHRQANAAMHTAHAGRLSRATVWNYFCQTETRGRGVGLSLTRKAAPDKSERCFWHEFSRETEKKTPWNSLQRLNCRSN